MKSNITTYLLTAALASSLLVSCGTDFGSDVDDFEPSAGSADFSTFIAIGDSLTAGYKDSALYREGQENSYPAILAQQFATVGGGAFVQPLRAMSATGSFVGIPTALVADRLVAIGTGNPDRPLTAATITPTVAENLVPMPGMLFNNFGVPAAKSFHLPLDSYGDPLGGATANPFYIRFATIPAGAGIGSSMIGDAAARNPTFFILWIGNNDILLNATEGSPGGPGLTFGTGSTDVTPNATFDATYPGLVAALNSPTNKGMLVNIPDVSSIPFFTTVPHNEIPLDAATAATLNGLFMAYNNGVNGLVGIAPGLTQAEADSRQINFVEGNNRILILDESLTDLTGFNAALTNMRQATADDFILLTAASKLGTEQIPGNPTTVWGVSNPLLDTDVLVKTEVDALNVVRAAYNATIKAQADADPNLLYFDAAALLEIVGSTGLSYGSGGISSSFILGGGFSLDGVHPTARGYAVIANEMMKAINEGFGANLPPVDPGEFSTIFYQ